MKIADGRGDRWVNLFCFESLKNVIYHKLRDKTVVEILVIYIGNVFLADLMLL